MRWVTSQWQSHAALPRGCTFVSSDSSSSSSEIHCISWNHRVQYRIHNSPTVVCYPNPYQSVHALPSHFLKIHFNIILPSRPRSGFLTETLFASSFSPVRVPPFIWCSSLHSFLQFLSHATYLPQHPILEHPQPIFLPYFEKPRFIHI